jgi:hypothetical protein
MESKGIQWGGMLRDGSVPTNLLRLGDQAQRSSCQRRHVQRLANVTSRIRRVAVVMVERCARNEVQQRQAAQDRQGAAQAVVAEDGSDRVHTLIVQCTSLDGLYRVLVAAIAVTVNQARGNRATGTVGLFLKH